MQLDYTIFVGLVAGLLVGIAGAWAGFMRAPGKQVCMMALLQDNKIAFPAIRQFLRESCESNGYYSESVDIHYIENGVVDTNMAGYYGS